MSGATHELDPSERSLAAFTHLSGLASYLIPCGGVIAPVIIWIVKSDSPVISAIAKQAVILNVAAFVVGLLGWLLFLTVILIPVAAVLWLFAAAVAIVLPIVGAVKAFDGAYYRYPVVGLDPS